MPPPPMSNRVKGRFPLGGIFLAKGHFPLENVMSMRSSLLICVKFLQKNSSRWRQEVENCSTFQRCRTAGKDLNMAGAAVGLICHWIPARRGSETSKYYCETYERSPVYFNLKETSLKRRNKCEIHWQAECHH